MKKGELLEKALHTMVNAHSGQFDQGGKPYAMHPLAVMALLDSDDEELQCIALLHDAVEDSKLTFKELYDIGFTDRIVTGVRDMTKMRGQTEDEYYENLKKNKDAILVKMADLTHNSDLRRLKGLRDKDIDRMIKYQKRYWELKQILEGME